MSAHARDEPLQDIQSSGSTLLSALQSEHGAHPVLLLLTGGSHMCADDSLQCLLL